MKRVFISYRSSDGKKEASRLAEDLGEVFDEQAVFYDKHNLHGGTSWREQVRQALGNQPVVLVLLTPDYFGAIEGGELRIHRDDDPVRQELLAAFDAQATVLPLLTEGVTMPRPAALPSDLARITEVHALKLRTEDWRTDFTRLVKDLRNLGLTLKPGVDEPGPVKPATGGYKWLGWAAGLALLFAISANNETDRDTVLGLAALGLLPLWLAWRGRKRLATLPGAVPKAWSWATLVWCGLVCIGLVGAAGNLPPKSDAPVQQPGLGTAPGQQPPVQPVVQQPPAPQPTSPTAQDNLTGAWLAHLSNGTQLPFTLLHRGEQVVLSTTKLDVRNDPTFVPMNQYLARTQGFTVTDIRVRGQGQLQGGAIELAMQMTDGDNQRMLDQGNMSLVVTDGGRTLAGSVHFASGSPTPIRLARQ